MDRRYKISEFQDKAEGARTKKHVQYLARNIITKENVEVIGITMTVNAPALILISDIDTDDTDTRTVEKELSPWSILGDLIETNKPPRTGTPLSSAIQEVDVYLDEDMLPIHKPDGTQNCPL